MKGKNNNKGHGVLLTLYIVHQRKLDFFFVLIMHIGGKMMNSISKGFRALNQCVPINPHNTTLMFLFQNGCNLPVGSK